MGWTPYHYVHQNPINLIDPTGMSAEGPPEGKYAQGHKHTDEQGVSWKLNGSVWENLSGGEDEWEPDTLNEIVIETDRSTDWKDVARTTAGFTPFLGSGLDIYEGIRDGNGWQVAGGIGGLILDVSTMGVGGVVIKGGAKALLKEAAEQGAEKVVKEGIYEFVAASGKKYIGQSKNIPKRLKQHKKSGKLLEETPVESIEVLGGKEAREIQEQLRINASGGIKNLENVRNPIGPNRQHLLKK